MELEDDKKGRVYVPDRSQRKAPGSPSCMRARGTDTTRDPHALQTTLLYIRNTVKPTTEVTRTEEGAADRACSRSSVGEPPSVDNARAR